MAPGLSGFASARKRAVLAICGLGLTEVLTLAVLVFESWLNTNYPGWEDSESEDAIVAAVPYFVVAVQAFAANIFCIVAFLMWIYRVSSNAFALRGAVFPRTTPTMSVVCWFIPFANLVWPFRVVRTLFWASDPLGERVIGDVVGRARWLLPVWWFTWLISSIAGNASFRLSLSDDPSSQRMATTIDFVNAPFSLVCALCAAAIVWSLHARQQAQFARTRHEAPAPGAFAFAQAPL